MVSFIIIKGVNHSHLLKTEQNLERRVWYWLLRISYKITMKLKVSTSAQELLNNYTWTGKQRCLRIEAVGFSWGGAEYALIQDEATSNDSQIVKNGIKFIIDQDLKELGDAFSIDTNRNMKLVIKSLTATNC